MPSDTWERRPVFPTFFYHESGWITLAIFDDTFLQLSVILPCNFQWYACNFRWYICNFQWYKPPDQSMREMPHFGGLQFSVRRFAIFGETLYSKKEFFKKSVIILDKEICIRYLVYWALRYWRSTNHRRWKVAWVGGMIMVWQNRFRYLDTAIGLIGHHSNEDYEQ